VLHACRVSRVACRVSCVACRVSCVVQVELLYDLVDRVDCDIKVYTPSSPPLVTTNQMSEIAPPTLKRGHSACVEGCEGDGDGEDEGLRATLSQEVEGFFVALQKNFEDVVNNMGETIDGGSNEDNVLCENMNRCKAIVETGKKYPILQGAINIAHTQLVEYTEEKCRREEQYRRARGALIIQGGVGAARSRTALMKKLKQCDYDPNNPNYVVYLFCSRQNEFNGTCFGALVTHDVKDFEGHYLNGVWLHDPTKFAPWGKKELELFYDLVDAVDGDLKAGKTVVVACFLGANRSKAVCYALNPTNENKPSCDSMERVANGYRNGRDLSIVPLAPLRTHRSR